MLVLTRKLQESILIGDDIKLTVIRTSANQVRIGIEAPRSVRVTRGEIPRFEDDPRDSTGSAPDRPKPSWNELPDTSPLASRVARHLDHVRSRPTADADPRFVPMISGSAARTAALRGGPFTSK